MPVKWRPCCVSLTMACEDSLVLAALWRKAKVYELKWVLRATRSNLKFTRVPVFLCLICTVAP